MNIMSIQRQRALVVAVILMLEHFIRWKEGIRIEVGLASNVSTCHVWCQGFARFENNEAA